MTLENFIMDFLEKDSDLKSVNFASDCANEASVQALLLQRIIDCIEDKPDQVQVWSIWLDIQFQLMNFDSATFATVGSPFSVRHFEGPD